MRNPMFITLVLLLNFSCAQNKSKHITEVSQSEFEKVILIDVRTPREFNEGHLENAQNIDWMGDTFEEEFNKLNKEDTYYLYCKSGGRSAAAMKFLNSLGFEHIVNLEGGYTAWKEANDK